MTPTNSHRSTPAAASLDAWKKPTARILAAFLVFAMLPITFSNVLGDGSVPRLFSAWGYPPQFFLIVGAAELIAVFLLFFPTIVLGTSLRFLGAGILSFDMARATLTHASVADVSTAMFTLSLLAWAAALAWIERPANRNATLQSSSVQYGPGSPRSA